MLTDKQFLQLIMVLPPGHFDESQILFDSDRDEIRYVVYQIREKC